ncbi:MAG: 4Fe-4S cluster-binding domain-containing protein [Oscillospiraceae bacterium]|nr:4Fe-4S cluster-binding domain-containing protein [Oscillospiraceae bacterium]
MDFVCSDCPRRCSALRGDEKAGGVCASPALPRVARAAPHFGEEPCLSGSRGAGAIFFTGCNLRCVYCQNREISRGVQAGKSVDAAALRDIMLRLRDEGVHCIDLVTPTHYVRTVRRALDGLSLGIPVVWNSSGYESVETLRTLEGLVQVYMPDYKYSDSALAARCSGAKDYPETAAAAIREMFRQTGPYRLDENGLLVSGVLIRHLILPGEIENSMGAIDFVAESFPRGSVLFSLMSQYTPMPGLEKYPTLQRRVEAQENEHLIRYMHACGISDGYWQELSSATAEEIPAFDGTGVAP